MRVDRIKLKTELVKREMRQSDLADMAGLSRATVMGITSGRSCKEETARKLADALNMPLEDLLENQRGNVR